MEPHYYTLPIEDTSITSHLNPLHRLVTLSPDPLPHLYNNVYKLVIQVIHPPGKGVSGRLFLVLTPTELGI